MTGTPGIPPQASEALARGDRIEAVRQIRHANPGMGLATAMQMLEAHDRAAPGAGVQPGDARTGSGVLQTFLAEAFATMSEGSKLDQIRQVRERTGLGLKDAAELVEREHGSRAGSREAQAAERINDLARRHGLQVPQAAIDALAAGRTFHALNLVRKTNRLGWRDMRALLVNRSAVIGQPHGTVMRDDRRFGTMLILFLLALAGLVAAYHYLAG